MEKLETNSDNIIDLEPSNFQIDTKAYRYKIKTATEEFLLTVLATSGTMAREGIKQKFPDASILFDGVSNVIMQVNDNSVTDV